MPSLQILLLIAAVGVPCLAQGQSEQVTKEEARRLLLQAPALRDSTVIREREYVERVLDFIGSIDTRGANLHIGSGLDAVRALEDLLAPDSVNLSLLSDPPGFFVRYYRMSSGARADIEVTTDTVVRVPAALYRINFFNNRTVEFRSQPRACLADCRIRWRH